MDDSSSMDPGAGLGAGGAPRGGLRRVVIWALVLVVLYFVVTNGIYMFVNSQIGKSVGEPVPAFSLKDLTGKKWSDADLRDGKVTVLNFFRSVCHGCDKERDAIFELNKNADPNKLRVIGVMMDKVQDFAPATTANTLKRFRV